MTPFSSRLLSTELLSICASFQRLAHVPQRSMVQLLEDVQLLELVQVPQQQQQEGDEAQPVQAPGKGQVGGPESLSAVLGVQSARLGRASTEGCVKGYGARPGVACSTCWLTRTAKHPGIKGRAPLSLFGMVQALCSARPGSSSVTLTNRLHTGMSPFSSFPLADHCHGADGHAAAVYRAGGAAVGAAAARRMERPVSAGGVGWSNQYLQVGARLRQGRAKAKAGSSGCPAPWPLLPRVACRMGAAGMS